MKEKKDQIRPKRKTIIKKINYKTKKKEKHYVKWTCVEDAVWQYAPLSHDAVI